MDAHKKRSGIFLLAAGIIMLAMAIPSYFWTRNNIDELAHWQNSKLSPVIMIPEVRQRSTGLTIWSSC